MLAKVKDKPVDSFIIPNAYLTWYGRRNIFKHECCICKKKFIPDTDADFHCGEHGRDEIRETVVEISHVKYRNILGTEQCVAFTRSIRQRNSKRNFNKVMYRDDFTCQYCSFNPFRHDEIIELHIDHVLPVSAGGTNDLENLVVACRICNLKASSKIFISFEDKKEYLSKERSRLKLPVYEGGVNASRADG